MLWLALLKGPQSAIRSRPGSCQHIAEGTPAAWTQQTDLVHKLMHASFNNAATLSTDGRFALGKVQTFTMQQGRPAEDCKRHL